ncbi:thioredoxin family protein [Crocinitomix catalasitica]|nr:thioredoxin family protein [Crocinitomix catalasitica]
MKKKIFGTMFILMTSLLGFAHGGHGIGEKATDFSLKGTDGEMHSLSEFTDAKGFIVIFTCNHCPYAKLYEDRIIELQNEFGPKGYPVIAINPNDPEVVPEDSFSNMKKRAKDKDFNFLYLFDQRQTVYPAYGATKTPHVFLLDADRIVQYIGAIDDNPKNADAVKERFLANAITALDAGKKIDPVTTKAIGCSIKKK